MDKEKIIKVVCEVCGIEVWQLKSPDKTRDTSDARKIIAHILMDRGICHSYKDAGKEVGLLRNSAYKALMYFNDLLKINTPFRFRYNTALNRLRDAD